MQTSLACSLAALLLFSACTTSEKVERVSWAELKESGDIPPYFEILWTLGEVTRSLGPSESPPRFEDCSWMCVPELLPALLPITCDSFSLQLLREHETGDFWIVQVGGIGGQGGEWFGPIDHDSTQLGPLRELLPEIFRSTEGEHERDPTPK